MGSDPIFLSAITAGYFCYFCEAEEESYTEHRHAVDLLFY